MKSFRIVSLIGALVVGAAAMASEPTPAPSAGGARSSLIQGNPRGSSIMRKRNVKRRPVTHRRTRTPRRRPASPAH
jgi:hypothetical protein